MKPAQANRSQRDARPAKKTKAELAAALGELQAYYEDLLSSLQDGVVILDRDSRVTYMNQATEELTGFSRSQIAGRPIAEVFPRPAPLAALAAKTLDVGRNHADFDAHVLRADGLPLTVSAVVSLISDPAGSRAAWCWSCGISRGCGIWKSKSVVRIGWRGSASWPRGWRTRCAIPWWGSGRRRSSWRKSKASPPVCGNSRR